MKGVPDDFLGPSKPYTSRAADAKALGLSSATLSSLSSLSLSSLSLGGGAKASSSDLNGAPIDMMSKFLLLITSNRMREALDMSKQILLYEPNNRIILEYQSSLQEYIVQGLDAQAEGKEGEEKDDDGDEEDEDEDEDEESESEGASDGGTDNDSGGEA